MSELLAIRRLVKDYQALRPLRIRELTVAPGTVVSIAGLDAIAAQTFVHLVTGATLPEEGDVTLFDHNTRAITDGDAWLQSLDGVGIVTARGILIESFSVLQNIAMSYTLEVDPVDPLVAPQAAALGRDVGVTDAQLDQPAGRVPAEVQMRVHLARSLALGPKILIAEHPSAALPRDSVATFGADLARVARSRGLALIAITADDVLAKAIGGQRLELVPATGELRPRGLLKKIFG